MLRGRGASPHGTAVKRPSSVLHRKRVSKRSTIGPSRQKQSSPQSMSFPLRRISKPPSPTGSTNSTVATRDRWPSASKVVPRYTSTREPSASSARIRTPSEPTQVPPSAPGQG